WDFSTSNAFCRTKSYIFENNIGYFMVNLDLIKQQELNYFLKDNNSFSVIFENEQNIIFQTVGNYTNYNDDVYKGTWNFYDENDGTQGNNIAFIDYYYNVYGRASIKAEKNHHKKVLELYSYNKNGNVLALNYMDCPYGGCDVYVAERGTIEFWVLTEEVHSESRFRLAYKLNGTSDVNLVNIHINNSKFQYFNDCVWTDIGINASNNLWYHIKIEFNCKGSEIYHGLTKDRFNFYINDTLLLENEPFINSGKAVDYIALRIKQNTNSSVHTYFDAFGYSWDKNYNIGDNRYELC
ncbi:MAG: hypothetical protein ACTSWY_04060, partial [Promethearchaeota archaeon]